MKLTMRLGNQKRLTQLIPLQWSIGDDAPPLTSFNHTERFSLEHQGCWHAEQEGFLLVIIGTCNPASPDPEVVNTLAKAQQLFSNLGGNAVAILLDKNAGKIKIRTDILGLFPFYLTRQDDQLLFSSETKYFGDQPNIAAWAELIHFGYQFGDHCLVEGVIQLSGASIFEWDLYSLAETTQCYWYWPEPNFKPDISLIAETFQNDVHQYLTHSDNGQLLLSGGLDSRLILFALLKEQRRPHCLIVKHQEEAFDADGRLARRLAVKFKLPFSVVTPDANYFSSRDYLNHVSSCDACYPTLALFISQLSPFITQYPVWEGAIPNYTISTMMSCPNDLSQQLQAMGANFNGHQWQAARAIFKPVIIEAMREHIEEMSAWAKNHFSDDEFGTHQMMARSRLRRRTAAVPSSIYQKQVPVFLPGSSRDFLNASASIPFAQRNKGALYRRLYQHAYPGALSVPIISGSKILGIDNAPLTRQFIRYQSRIARFIGERPRLHSLLTTMSLDLQTSCNPLLSSQFLYDPSDPMIREDIEQATLANSSIQKVLFQWQSWRLLHQAKLNQRAEEVFQQSIIS